MMTSGGRFSVGSCRSFAQIRISRGNTLYPVEIRKHADPGKSDVAKFDILDGISGVIRGQGGVVCLYDKLITLKDADMAIPVTML